MGRKGRGIRPKGKGRNQIRAFKRQKVREQIQGQNSIMT
jgi:hypothetical protein